MQPLPIIKDGAIRIDNSGCEAIQHCPRYAWQLLMLRRTSAARDPAKAFGTAIHAALEHRYRKLGARAVDKETALEQEAILAKHFEGVELPLDEHRNLGGAKDVIGHYNATHGAELFDVLATELPYERELGVVEVHDGPMSVCVPLIYQGKTDGILRYAGRPRIRDFKTTTFYTAEREHAKWTMSGQMRGYCWLFSDPALAYGTIRTAQLDIMVLRPPLQRVTSKSLPRVQVERLEYSYTDTEIEEWRLDTLRIVENWVNQCVGGPPPMHRRACAWPTRCQFFDVCSCGTEEQRMAWLQSGAFVDNTWNPLKHEEAA